MKKEAYERIEFELIRFQSEDVLLNSEILDEYEEQGLPQNP